VLTLSLTNTSTQNTQIYQVATSNPTTSYTVIQASHVSTGTTNNALVINPSGGNVGVGTTAPSTSLHVLNPTLQAGNTTMVTAQIIGRPATGGVQNGMSGGFAIGAANAGINSVGRMDMMVTSASSAGNAFGYTPDVPVMTLLGSGNVGIGTTAPIAPLHVTAPGNGLTSVQYAGGAAQWYTVVGNYPTTTGSVLTIPIVNQGGNWSTTMFRIRGFNGRYNNSGAPLQFTAECATVTLGTGQGGVTVLSIGGNTASVTFNQSSVSLLINFTTAYGAGAVAVVIEYLATLPSTTVIPASISAN